MANASDKVTFVSLDAHAMPPPEVWTAYLEPEFHGHLDALRSDHAMFSEVMGELFVGKTHEAFDVFDVDGVYREAGIGGLHDLDRRLLELDREGVAGEFVYNGDPRIASLFFGPSNRYYGAELAEAGVRGHHRWVTDTFGASDRLLRVATTGHAPCFDIDATVAELRWCADHGFIGTMLPMSTGFVGQPPLHDPHWEPFWAACAELGLFLVVHAGWGPVQGDMSDFIESVYRETHGGDSAEAAAAVEAVNQDRLRDIFKNTIVREPLAPLFYSGVFDRYPTLKLLLTEIRADWLPATIARLDDVYLANRSELPARRTPSEYWNDHGITCLSFAHRAEIEMRHEIGVDKIAFGRDYPHPEGTWPNTGEWVRAAFEGVPDDELRAMMGGNAIRILGLDGARLDAEAQRIGRTIAELRAGPPVPTALLEHFDERGGYLKPYEGDAQLASLEGAIQRDVAAIAARA